MQIRNRTFFISENVSDFYRRKFAKEILLRSGKLAVSADDRADYVIYNAQNTERMQDIHESCVKVTVNEMVSFLDSAPQSVTDGFCVRNGVLEKWIPEEFEGHSLIIPSGVTRILSSAFTPVYPCQKTVFRNAVRQVWRIVFPRSLRVIEPDAFRGFVNLRTIRLNEGLQELGGFRKCTSLDNVEIPESCTKISDYAFSNCTSLSHVQWTENIQEIGMYAFSAAALKDFAAWKCLEKIGAYAFQKCRQLTEVELSTHSIECGRNAFSETGVEKLTVHSGSCVLSKGCFASCRKLKEYHLEPGNIKICPDTFPGSLISNVLYHLHGGTCTDQARIIWTNIIRSSGLKFIEQLPPDLYVGYAAFCAETAGIKGYKADIRKAVKKEAMNRLKWLVKNIGLNPHVPRYFNQGKLYYSYLTGGGFLGSIDTISYDPDYEQKVKEAQEESGILVYHVIESYSFSKELVMLCIESDWRDWSISRPDSDVMMAYVYNYELGEGEFGDVVLSSYDGALIRVG